MVAYNSNTYLIDKTEIKIRNLEPDDVESYLNFSEMISTETPHTLYYPGQIMDLNTIKTKFHIAASSAGTIELGGFKDDKLISLLSLYKTRPYHPFEMHTGEFAIRILKDYCGKGLGSEKILLMEDIARTMNILRLQARVRITNFSAVKFYQKHNYEIEGTKKNAVFINGSFEDEYYIAKILR